MGYAHILYVFEDGIRNAEHSSEQFAAIGAALGRAVLKVCLSPDVAPMGEDVEVVRRAPVLNHANCVNWAGAEHSSDFALYAFTGNCLRELSAIEDEALERARCLIEAEIKRRCDDV